MKDDINTKREEEEKAQKMEERRRKTRWGRGRIVNKTE